VPTTSSLNHRTPCLSLPRRSIRSPPTYRSVECGGRGLQIHDQCRLQCRNCGDIFLHFFLPLQSQGRRCGWWSSCCYCPKECWACAWAQMWTSFWGWIRHHEGRLGRPDNPCQDRDQYSRRCRPNFMVYCSKCPNGRDFAKRQCLQVHAVVQTLPSCGRDKQWMSDTDYNFQTLH